MDLKSLRSVTRRALEVEARRWGVPEPQLRSRAELMRLIVQYAAVAPFAASRKRISEGRAAIEQARESLEVARYVAVDLASEMLPASLREVAKAKLRARPAASAAPVTPAAAAPDYDVVEAAGEPHRTAPAVSAAAQSAAARAAGAGVAPLPPASFAPGDVSAEEVPEVGYTPGLDPFAISEPVRTIRARSLAPSAPPPRRFEAEPIRTLSMARLLASAGERERALAVYEELIARASGDPVLRREAEILRAGGDLRGLPKPEYTPTKVPRPPGDETPSDAHIRWERSAGGERITAHFDVSDSGIARAQAVLGERGELTLRLVTIRPDASKVVRSEVEDHALPGREGAFEIGPVDPQARCLLSLGLRAGTRFVSITHGAPQP